MSFMYSARGLAALCAAPLLTLADGSFAHAPADANITITRNAQGVPHITAADERGLGYGYGYAYAQDNLCLLANEVLTVRGERSRYLGADGKLPNGMSNLESDVFFQWLNSDASVKAFLDGQDVASHALLSGYAAGFNRYLADTPAARRPAACGTQAWLRPIDEADMARLLRRLTVEAGVGHFARAIVAARPPQAQAAPDAAEPRAEHAAALADWASHAETRGSNAIALGRDATASGAQGILLGNPHFPWSGGLRFYQVRLTIPGRLDVTGASLAGVPAVNIGFNRHMAWTHTVDTSRHFVVYRLPRDPARPDHYLVDGKSVPLVKRTVRVPLASSDEKAPVWREHVVYETQYGPALVWPGVADWTADALYAIADPNLGNDRALRQWYAINKAESADAVRDVVSDVLGIPWVNTVVADGTGKALYMNVSVVPGISAEQIARCRVSPPASPLPVLDGSRAACAPQNNVDAPQPGVLPATAMPMLERFDFVQNSNDSAWMTQPAAPLTGYSPLVSQQEVALGERARYALDWLAAGRRFSAEDVRRMVLSDEVGAARWVLDDLLLWCKRAGQATDAARACGALKTWDRSATLASGAGLFYFEVFMQKLAQQPALWAQPFDPARPLATPRGLKIDDAAASQQIGAAVGQASQAVAAAGIGPDTTLAQVQGVRRGDAWISIPGASGKLGVYNAIESASDGRGRREVVSGTSYLQVVAFDGTPAPRAWTLLAYSQSTDPASPYFRAQTEQYARGEWTPFDFDRRDIVGEPLRLIVR